MPPNVRPTPPFFQRLVAGTLATFAGIWLLAEVGRDFEFIKFEPRSPEEVEKRKANHEGLSIRHLDSRTLDYKPEAKERLRKMMEEKGVTDEKKD